MTSTSPSQADLTPAQRRHLSGLGHHLSPLVLVGKDGISDGVVAALDQALLDHELVKVRLGSNADEERKAAAAELAKRTKAHSIAVVGRVLLMYREHPEKPKIKLPKAKRGA